MTDIEELEQWQILLNGCNISVETSKIEEADVNNVGFIVFLLLFYCPLINCSDEQMSVS